MRKDLHLDGQTTKECQETVYLCQIHTLLYVVLEMGNLVLKLNPYISYGKNFYHNIFLQTIGVGAKPHELKLGPSPFKWLLVLSK